MDIEKAIEHLKSDLVYAKKNNFNNSAIKLKINIINSIIDFYNLTEQYNNELELQQIELSYKNLKLEMMLLIIGIDYDDIKRNIKKPLLYFKNLFNAINKNKNGIVCQKRLIDYFIENDIENEKYQITKLINDLNEKHRYNRARQY